MKIVSLIPYKIYPPKMGGQKGIALFYEYFAKLSSLTVVTVKANTTKEIKPFKLLPVISNSKLRYINILLFFKLKRIIRSEQATHFIIEHPYFGWLGILLKILCNVKLVVHSHNIETLRFKTIGKWWWRILWHYEKLVHRNADLSFFVTDEDKQFAIEHFKLNALKCTTITYGIDKSVPPTSEEKKQAKNDLCNHYGIKPTDKILLFNGTLDYKPNLDALMVILESINPILLKATNFKYKIIICGKNLPAYLNQLQEYKDMNIIYAGFVEDITIYFKAADIFINPVIEGGGIKTKLVEALGYNNSVVTTRSGAIGVAPTLTGDKMKVIENNDWPTFANAIVNIETSLSTPDVFYDYFYWGGLVSRALNFIK